MADHENLDDAGDHEKRLLLTDLQDTKLPISTTIEELKFLQRGGLGAVYVGEDMRGDAVLCNAVHRWPIDG